MKALLAIAVAAAVSASPALAQQKDTTKADHSKMDHSKMDHSSHNKQQGGDHAASGWKELDAYHMLMMQTWHPIKDKGDVGPIRLKAAEMVQSAKLLAKSTPPKKCDTPALKKAAATLVSETEGVAGMVAKKGSDAQLKDAMKVLHDKFEVLEEGCSAGGHGGH